MKQIDREQDLEKIIEGFCPAEELGFGKTMAPIMIKMDFKNGSWGEMRATSYRPLQLDPAAKVLHYAQEIFEGLKAYKNMEDEVYLFRPDMNAKRFNRSAQRLAMPELPEEDFIQSVTFFAKAMAKHVPTGLGRSLYLRPFMIATEPTLGVRASSAYSYILIGAVVESYFNRPNVRVLVEEENSRAVPGGVGYAKTGANYGASLLAYEKAQRLGLDQTLWLDAVEKTYVEELSGMNFFALIGKELVTPSLTDTILAGVTRDSILSMAKDFGLVAREKRINIDELLEKVSSGECEEAFACGTASVLTPIASLTYKEREYQLAYPEGKKSPIIKERLLKLQRGQAPDPLGWALKVN